MPNQVTYHDDETLFKVIDALVGQDELPFNQAREAVRRMQNAGILFREPRRDEKPLEETAQVTKDEV